MQTNPGKDRKTLRVELFESIRTAVNREGLSIHKAAERFGVHRKTVRQALKSAVPPERKKAPVVRPKLGPYEQTVRAWLKADEEVPPKQRHTATRVWQRLVDEEGAEVSRSAVSVMVKALRTELGYNTSQAHIPQEHLPGQEAEVDFGDVFVVIGGQRLRAKLFSMRLCHSGKAYHVVYHSESQECFLDGHERSFAAFGGVPSLIRYDNLTQAVTKVLLGRDRNENPRFVAFRSHWGFESVYCRPGEEGAHEKGGIEGEIKRSRRRYFVPVPRGASLEEINQALWAKVARDDATRHVGYRITTVAQDFAAERASLSPLAAENFGVAALVAAKVDSKSRVSVRSCHYSVPTALIGRRVQVLLYPQRVEITYAAAVVATHERLFSKGASSLALDHYLEAFSTKPGAFIGSVPLAQARRCGVFTQAHEAFLNGARRRYGEREATREMVEVLLASRRLPKAAISAGLEAAVAEGVFSADFVEIRARASLEPATGPVLDGVPEVRSEIVGLSRYDTLISQGARP